MRILNSLHTITMKLNSIKSSKSKSIMLNANTWMSTKLIWLKLTPIVTTMLVSQKKLLKSSLTSWWITKRSRLVTNIAYLDTPWQAMTSCRCMSSITSVWCWRLSTSSILRHQKNGFAKGTWMNFGTEIALQWNLILLFVTRKQSKSSSANVSKLIALKSAQVSQWLSNTSRLKTT